MALCAIYIRAVCLPRIEKDRAIRHLVTNPHVKCNAGVLDYGHAYYLYPLKLFCPELYDNLERLEVDFRNHKFDESEIEGIALNLNRCQSVGILEITSDAPSEFNEKFVSMIRCKINYSCDITRCRINTATCSEELFNAEELIFTYDEFVFADQKPLKLNANYISFLGTSIRTAQTVNIHVHTYRLNPSEVEQGMHPEGSASLVITDFSGESLNFLLDCDHDCGLYCSGEHCPSKVKVTGNCRILDIDADLESDEKKIEVDAGELIAQNVKLSGDINFHCKKSSPFYKAMLSYPRDSRSEMRSVISEE